MNKKMFLLPLMLVAILSSVVVSTSAVSYVYEIEIDSIEPDGDKVFRAYTDDPAFSPANNGKVTFWLYLDEDCSPPVDEQSPQIPTSIEGGYYVSYYVFDGSGDSVYCVKAHFQGDCYSMWSECTIVPWFDNLALGMLAPIGIIAILRHKKRI